MKKAVLSISAAVALGVLGSVGYAQSESPVKASDPKASKDVEVEAIVGSDDPAAIDGTNVKHDVNPEDAVEEAVKESEVNAPESGAWEMEIVDDGKNITKKIGKPSDVKVINVEDDKN